MKISLIVLFSIMSCVLVACGDENEQYCIIDEGKIFEGFVLPVVGAQNTSNPDREIDLNSSSALMDLYALWDSLLVNSDGHYIKKTIVGKDGSGEYDIIKIELSIDHDSKKTRKKVFVMPNQHGTPYDPIDASWTCYYLAKLLSFEYTDYPILELIHNELDVTMFVCCNPWGMVNKSYGTYIKDPNGYHINCNRNWDYMFIPNNLSEPSMTSSGPEPFCIPETRYLMETILNDGIDMVIDFHSYGDGALGRRVFVASESNPCKAWGDDVMDFVSKVVDGVYYKVQLSESKLNGLAGPWITLKQKKDGVTLECACQSYKLPNTKFDSNPLTADLYALVGMITMAL